MKEKLLILGIVGLFLLSSVPSLSGLSFTLVDDDPTTSNFFVEDDAVAPEWEVGHTWTYEATLNGGFPGYWTFSNIRTTDLVITVEEVQSDSYLLSFSASISGSVVLKVSIITISGTLQDTGVEGDLLVNKSKLTYDAMEDFVFDGFIKPNLLPKIPFSFDGDVLMYYGTPLLNFPINNYESWNIDEIAMSTDINVNLLPDPVQEEIYIQAHYAECLEWDIVNVDAGEYDALPISTDLGDEHITWYSVAAGNIIKVRGRDLPVYYGSFGEYNVDMELKSTNFHIDSNPPSVPTTISGPTELVAGVSGEYIAGGSVDPDGDLTRYIYDWGDGTQSGSDFVVPGQDVALEHYWTEKGQFEIKVKARDKYGAESGWSDPFTVNILNDPPLIPDPPSGPPEGKIKQAYSYSASSSDPDGHRIRFKFDWGDGTTSYSGYVNSGETGSAYHSWNRKGDYQIRVKAVDEYGEESGWSDPTPVYMPRKISLYQLFSQFLENHPNLFPILRQILDRFF